MHTDSYPELSKQTYARLTTELGVPVMEVEQVLRQGSSLRIQGVLMERVNSSLYLKPRDFYCLVRMMLGPSCLVFAFLSPFYWLRDHARMHRRSDRLTILRRLAGFIGLVVALYLIVPFLIAMIALGIYGLAR